MHGDGIVVCHGQSPLIEGGCRIKFLDSRSDEKIPDSSIKRHAVELSLAPVFSCEELRDRKSRYSDYRKVVLMNFHYTYT